ncbi:hypothetical protein VULLAG_LOCUS15172 [Vulpes lagopus]
MGPGDAGGVGAPSSPITRGWHRPGWGPEAPKAAEVWVAWHPGPTGPAPPRGPGFQAPPPAPGALGSASNLLLGVFQPPLVSGRFQSSSFSSSSYRSPGPTLDPKAPSQGELSQAGWGAGGAPWGREWGLGGRLGGGQVGG